VVTVTGGHNKRVSLAALIAVKPGCRTRLIYRVHHARRRGDKRKGFTETDYARLLDDAHQQLGGPVVVVWEYVPRNIFHVLCPTALCGGGSPVPVLSGCAGRHRPHNDQSDDSQLSSDSSDRQIG
jgi:hypothetical protein